MLLILNLSKLLLLSIDIDQSILQSVNLSTFAQYRRFLSESEAYKPSFICLTFVAILLPYEVSQ